MAPDPFGPLGPFGVSFGSVLEKIAGRMLGRMLAWSFGNLCKNQAKPVVKKGWALSPLGLCEVSFGRVLGRMSGTMFRKMFAWGPGKAAKTRANQ